MRERKREIQILDQERSLRGSPEEKGWPIRFSQIPHSGVLFPTVPGRRRKRKKQGGEGRRRRGGEREREAQNKEAKSGGKTMGEEQREMRDGGSERGC